MIKIYFALRWRHNGHDSVSNHQPHDCFLNRLFRRRSKKTSKLRVTGLCVGNSPGEFPAQMASNTEKMFPFYDVIMISLVSDDKNIFWNIIDDFTFDAVVVTISSKLVTSANVRAGHAFVYSRNFSHNVLAMFSSARWYSTRRSFNSCFIRHLEN